MSEELNNILDESIDDLADAPENKPFPNGAHLVSLKVKRATGSDKKVKPGVYIIDLKYKNLEELTDPDTEEEKLSKAGDTFSIWLYTLKKDGSKNEIGQGDLKKIIKPIADQLGLSTISEVIDSTKDGVDCIVVTQVRVSNDPKYQDSMSIKQLTMV